MGKLLNQEEFIRRAVEIHGEKYDYSKVIYKSRTKVEIICKNHGSFWIRSDTHLYGRGCPKCSIERVSKHNTLTLEEFIQQAKRIHGKKYNYSKVIYKNIYTKIEIVCPKHGSFWQVPNTHLKKKGCPKCRASKGELAISKWLEENEITYISQHTFSDLRSKSRSRLRFDFYIPATNMCIEFDGQQHYDKCYVGKHLITKEDFSNIQHKDTLKNEYTLKNGIRLVRIPYWDIKNIPTILAKVMNISPGVNAFGKG